MPSVWIRGVCMWCVLVRVSSQEMGVALIFKRVCFDPGKVPRSQIFYFQISNHWCLVLPGACNHLHKIQLLAPQRDHNSLYWADTQAKSISWALTRTNHTHTHIFHPQSIHTCSLPKPKTSRLPLL